MTNEIKEMNLELVDISLIYDHPNNPRKDLGDLEELSNSIAKNGIMQNLTVMHGHFEDGKLLKDGYTLLIGHRRCAAAKKAGLTKVPCKIVDDISQSDQVATMLCENIQRTGLTVTEQGQGFQMMLDLGDTAKDISDKTGFSKATVRHRLNIAKLDQDLLKDKENNDSFQLNLTDLYELEKIKDLKTRNDILKNSTTSRDMRWKITSAIGQEKRKKTVDKYIAEFDKLGMTKISDEEKKNIWKNYELVYSIYILDDDNDIDTEKLNKCKGGKYYAPGYEYRSITVYTDKTVKEDEADAESKLAEAKRTANKDILDKLCKDITSKVKSFVLDIIDGKIEPLKEDLTATLLNAVLDANRYISATSIKEFYANNNWYSLKEDEKNKANEWYDTLSAYHKILCLYAKMICSYPVDYSGCFIEDKAISLLENFKILEKYGFSFTEEEAKLFNGTHEAYNEKKNEDNDEEDEYEDKEE